MSYDGFKQKEVKELKYEVEYLRSLVEYIVDESGHCDHISLGKLYEEFDEWLEDQGTTEVNPKPSEK